MFTIEYSVESEFDFELILDHLIERYTSFGESPREAFARASQRVRALRLAFGRLSTFPLRGTNRSDVLPGARSIEIDRAVFWFAVDEGSMKVTVLAVFFGGQDHVRHMLLRQLASQQDD
jgi:plasmid stabilization system protein ParE